MAYGTGIATLNFPASPQAAEYVSATVVSDSAPNPNINNMAWVERTLPVSINWKSVAYGNGVFVAIAQTSAIAVVSSDGISWAQVVMPISSNWYAITYGNGVFVAISYNSTIGATSQDGIIWTRMDMPISASWYAVTYGNGKFIAVATSSETGAVSPNGVNWSTVTLPKLELWLAVAYGNNIFVAVAGSSPTAATSPDGVGSGLPPLANTRTISAVSIEIQPAKPSPGTNQAKVTVTGLSGVTANSSASAFLLGSDSTSDHNAYEHEIIDLELTCDNFVPGVGFDITATSTQRLEGDFKVRYAWGTDV